MAWALVLDKAFEFTFTLYEHGSAQWPLEWRILSQKYTGPVLGFSFDLLNSSLNGLRVSIGQNLIPAEVQQTFKTCLIKVLADYFDQFGKTAYSVLVFYVPNKRNPTLLSFYDSLYEHLKKSFSFLKDGQEWANVINSQKITLIPQMDVRKYYILINTLGPKMPSLR